MRLTHISVKNYRTLEDININFPTDYCTISGHNNAGKSSIIRILRILLEQNRPSFDMLTLDYNVDKTQWHKAEDPIVIECAICLNKNDDCGLLNFIEKISRKNFDGEDVHLQISTELSAQDIKTQKVKLDKCDVQDTDAKEILRKLRSMNCLSLHNSTLSSFEHFLFSRTRLGSGYPIVFSAEEQTAIATAEETLLRKIKKLTRDHKNELENMIGKLNEKFAVEFSTIGRLPPSRMPIDVNLSDRSAEVPLADWGSGTQNRTRILISILQAKKIKTASVDDRITPVVVIEEPESFLHPNAQSEFGSVLQTLSSELKIQIIASTHSPYMLNQISPSSNILLRRKTLHKKPQGSEIADTTAEEWMTPFAEHLGIIPPEFDKWRHVFAKHGSRIVLVEGESDKEYIEYLRKRHQNVFSISQEIEIVAYNGKDALKNVALVKFVLSKVEKAFITFDLDADSEVKKPLLAIGLIENQNFAAVGLNKPGRDAIEGLLPDRVLSAVNGRETDLIMQLQSVDGSQRKDAKRVLKKKYLEEFKSMSDFSESELEPLSKLARLISKHLGV